MDPTPEVVATIVDFSGLFQAAKIPDSISSALLAQLGDPSDLRELAFVSGDDWSACVDSLKVLRDPPAALTAFSPVEKGKLRLVRKILEAGSGLASGSGRPGPPGTLSEPTKKVKSSSLVDPIAEAELVQLSGAAVRQMFARCERERGDVPHQAV